MGFDQYHEPPEELSAETRTIARMLVSLTEEAEAINWYEQRISVEKDPEAKAIMENAQQEEFKHFGMDLEFLLRKKEKWRTTLKEVLFKSGDIVKLGEKGEEKADWESKWLMVSGKWKMVRGRSGNPLATHYSPLTIHHYSPFTTCHSPCN